MTGTKNSHRGHIQYHHNATDAVMDSDKLKCYCSGDCSHFVQQSHGYCTSRTVRLFLVTYERAHSLNIVVLKHTMNTPSWCWM